MRPLTYLKTSVIFRSFSSGLTTKKLTNAEVTQKRNELFSTEKARQMALINRVEKIQIQHRGAPEDCTLLMNKGLSTPFHCAMHIQEVLMMRSVLALVNGQPWDMHRPLTDDCELRFLHFKDADPSLSNETFWRSGSFLIGYVLERCFKDEHYVELCSFPKPDVRSGSFVYDVDLKLPDWKPTAQELNCLSRHGGQLQSKNLRFERLDIDASLAAQMFEDNRFKSAQIEQIAAQSATGFTVTVYRLGDHVDISRGPLMASTSLLQRFTITSVHDISSPEYGCLKRVQGLAFPKQLPVHFWSYDLLCQRAAQPNKSAPTPRLKKSDQQHNTSDDAQQNISDV